MNTGTGQVRIRVGYGQALACAVLVVQTYKSGATRLIAAVMWGEMLQMRILTRSGGGVSTPMYRKRKCTHAAAKQFRSQRRNGCVDKIVSFVNEDGDFVLRLAHAVRPLSLF